MIKLSNYLDDDGKYQATQPMWHFGDPSSRKCVAYRLAEFEAVAAIAKMLHEFKLSLPKDHPEIHLVTTFTNSPSHDIRVRFERIQHGE